MSLHFIFCEVKLVDLFSGYGIINLIIHLFVEYLILGNKYGVIVYKKNNQAK